MPLPIILGIGAGIAALAGVGAGVNGAVKMKEANDTMESANYRHKKNIARFEDQQKNTTEDMDNVGAKELAILKSFETFSQLFEKIQNRPQFTKINKDGIQIPVYNKEELKKVSVGAGVLLGGLGGAAAGTAGAFAAGGATTAAVMALGTASTGTAIATLSGAAATNAALAALGGGALGSVAGAGGMALGTTILGAATLGVGLLVGGIIFNITGSSLSDKADEAWSQMKKAEKEIDTICEYLGELHCIATKFYQTLCKIETVYSENLTKLANIIEVSKKTNWNQFSSEEKLITENTTLLVDILYTMCKTELVLKSTDATVPNKVNKAVVEIAISNAEHSFKKAA